MLGAKSGDVRNHQDHIEERYCYRDYPGNKCQLPHWFLSRLKGQLVGSSTNVRNGVESSPASFKIESHVKAAPAPQAINPFAEDAVPDIGHQSRGCRDFKSLPGSKGRALGLTDSIACGAEECPSLGGRRTLRDPIRRWPPIAGR